MALLEIFCWTAVITIFSTVVTVSQAEYVYQSYQKSITCTSTHSLREPRSLSEIQDIVKFAIALDIKVKVIGSQHSIIDSICTTGIPVKLTHITHFSYNPDTQVATIGAGAQIQDFYESLHQYNRTVNGHPQYGGITIGGALGTGAHGSTLKASTTLSQQIISVTFVDGRGNVRKVTRDHPDFKAFRVNLGLLGILYDVEVATVPQYKLSFRVFPISDSIIWNGTNVLTMARQHDYFHFAWFPTNKQIVLTMANQLPVSVPGNCQTRYVTDFSTAASNAFSVMVETFQKTRDDIGLFHIQSYAKLTCYKAMPGRDPLFVEEDRETSCLNEGPSIGFSHRMLTNRCAECFWTRHGRPIRNDDFEIVIPAEKLMPALRTLGEIFDRHLVQFPLDGILVRFLTGADAYLAVNEGNKDWVAIEWQVAQRWDQRTPKLGLAAYQTMGQVLVEQYGGRPHWGKNSLYYTSPQIIRQSHSNLDKFIAAMNTYDPQEVFMNTLGERLKYDGNEYTVLPRIAQHCALNEFCVCQSDQDCGNGGLLDCTCGHFLGFPKYNACLPGAVEQMKSSYTRSVINLIATLEFNEDSVLNYLRQYKILDDVLVYTKRTGLDKNIGNDNRTVQS